MLHHCEKIIKVLCFIGTILAYIAPEVVCGEVKVLSRCTDIYSFGMTMFEVLTTVSNPWEGILPVCAASIIKDILAKGQRPNLEEIDSVYAENTSMVVNVISKCWHQRPEERPTNGQVGVFILTEIRYFHKF